MTALSSGLPCSPQAFPGRYLASFERPDAPEVSISVLFGRSSLLTSPPHPFDIMLDAFMYKKSRTFTPTKPLTTAPLAPSHWTYQTFPRLLVLRVPSGDFKIKRVWAKEQDGTVKELFEGFFSSVRAITACTERRATVTEPSTCLHFRE
ncbi:hypothetical protein OG21DRAFT_1507705 [Imleria badia]|nr:hypothetical protein OG21DRAFT_1507705 [Imleria badia]